MRIGIIDLGSNSSRLVIYEILNNGAYHPIFEMKRHLRLAKHLNTDKRLSVEGLEKTVTCVQLFYRAGELYDVTDWITVATAAIRQAINQTEVLQTLREETGISFRVLSGDEEGRYGYLGVMNTINVQNAILFDIGGASTELMHVQDRQLKYVTSLPFGAINLSERFRYVPLDSQGDEIHRFMYEQYENITWLNQLKPISLIGMGGTARALAKFDRARRGEARERLHGHQISRDSLKDIYQEFKSVPILKRNKIKGVSKQREDILVAGLAAIEALAKRVSAMHLIVSRCGLREGLFYEYLFRTQQNTLVPSVLDHSVANFQKLYNVNTKIASMVTEIALYLFDSLIAVHGLNEYNRKILKVTAQIESCGYLINSEKWGKHSAYLTVFSQLYGLDHMELKAVANLMRGKVKGNLEKLSVLLQLAKMMILDLGILPISMRCTCDGDYVVIGNVPLKISRAVYSDDDLVIRFEQSFGKRILFINNSNSS